MFVPTKNKCYFWVSVWRCRRGSDSVTSWPLHSPSQLHQVLGVLRSILLGPPGDLHFLLPDVDLQIHWPFDILTCWTERADWIRLVVVLGVTVIIIVVVVVLVVVSYHIALCCAVHSTTLNCWSNATGLCCAVTLNHSKLLYNILWSVALCIVLSVGGYRAVAISIWCSLVILCDILLCQALLP